MAGVNGGALPRSPASYVHRATARAARRDVMCRAGGDPLQVVLCGRQRGQVAWPCGARVLVARRGGRRAGAVACAGARVVARVRGRAEAVWSGSCSSARAVRGWRAGLRPWCGVAVAARHAERRVRGRCGQTGAARVHAAERVLRARVGSMAVRGEGEGEPDRAWSAGRLGVARLLRSAREEEGRARPALEWPSGERERGRGGQVNRSRAGRAERGSAVGPRGRGGGE